jgi:23S rRNA (cytidine2498-2'-O)-methyltransferase
LSLVDYSQSLINVFSPFQGTCIYLSFEGYEEDLLAELNLNPKAKVVWKNERLLFVEGLIRPAIWAQSHWLHAKQIPIKSISEAQKILRQLFPRWNLFSFSSHRRSLLIQEALKTVKVPILNFLDTPESKSYGAWTLTNPNTLCFSTEVIPAIPPLGEVRFNEDKVNPPSRAYTKLWELFTIYGYKPKPGQRVIDMGSCPGGWTWALQQLGCQVVSVDKAPLEERVAKLSGIEYLKKDAFTLHPEDVGPLDCFFSDIICYPDKLYELVEKWRSSGLCKRFVCTIKFQGQSDFQALAKFASIPNSKLVHLYVNKHEVTWLCGF